MDTECCSSLASSSLGHGQAEESTKTLSRLRIQPINIPGKYERNHNGLEISIVSTSNYFQSWPNIGVGVFTAHPLGDRLSLQRRRAAVGWCLSPALLLLRRGWPAVTARLRNTGGLPASTGALTRQLDNRVDAYFFENTDPTQKTGNDRIYDTLSTYF